VEQINYKSFLMETGNTGPALRARARPSHAEHQHTTHKLALFIAKVCIKNVLEFFSAQSGGTGGGKRGKVKFALEAASLFSLHSA
jgi:hypothetical protein